MALLKLYESADAMTPLPGPWYSGEDINASSFGWYMRRYDCAVIMNTVFGGCFKIYRSGKVVRVCRSALGSGIVGGFDTNIDKMMSIGISTAPLYNDVIGMIWNPQDLAALTYQGTVTNGHSHPVVYGQKYYCPSGTNVIARNLTTGATIDTIAMGGSVTPFFAERVDVTDDGWLVSMDFDNGAFGVLRFHHLVTGVQYSSTVDRAKYIWLDRVNNNVWVCRLSDSKMVVYTTQVAPTTMSAITMGTNRCRYREDALSVTLTGSNGEPASNWPVEWTMSTSEGRLEFSVTNTNASGIATNRYAGPGATNYVGAALTITAKTAY